MTKRNEHTSVHVAKIAGRILGLKTATLLSYGNTRCPIWITDETPGSPSVSWKHIRALAASALNQAHDQSDRETLRKGKLPQGHKLVRRGKPIVRNGTARKRD